MKMWISYYVASSIGGRNEVDIRVEQSRSATPRALTAQHWGVASRPGQRRSLRFMAGTAIVVEAPTRAAAMMAEKRILDLVEMLCIFGDCWFDLECRIALCGIVLVMDLMVVFDMENGGKVAASYRRLPLGIGFRSPVV